MNVAKALIVICRESELIVRSICARRTTATIAPIVPQIEARRAWSRLKAFARSPWAITTKQASKPGSDFAKLKNNGATAVDAAKAVMNNPIGFHIHLTHYMPQARKSKMKLVRPATSSVPRSVARIDGTQITDFDFQACQPDCIARGELGRFMKTPDHRGKSREETIAIVKEEERRTRAQAPNARFITTDMAKIIASWGRH